MCPRGIQPRIMATYIGIINIKTALIYNQFYWEISVKLNIHISESSKTQKLKLQSKDKDTVNQTIVLKEYH